MGTSTMFSRRRRLLAALVVATLVLPSSQTEWKWEKGVVTAPEEEVLSPSPRKLVASQKEGQKSSQAEAVAGVSSTAETRKSHAVEVAPASGSPRFLGQLKTKMCSLGLGINKKREFIACRKNLKHRVTRDTKTDSSNEPSNRLFGPFGNSGLDGITGTSGLGGLAGSGLDGLTPSVTPSFGVHFGSLPNTGIGYTPFGGGYGSGHYGSSNPLGLDIGPVSLNPFVGFKVTKVGSKPVFTPSLDLLVTPNAKGVHALEGIKQSIKDKLSFKKDPYPYPYAGGYPYPSSYPSHGTYGHYQSSVYGSPAPIYPKPIPPPPPPPPPVYIPPKPVYRPPVYTPPRPPVYAPPKPAYSPPVYTPPKPAYSPPPPKPVAAYHPPQNSHISPVSEVHHHEHTHFHKHDHDRHIDGGFSPSYVPSISGFGRSDSSSAPLSTSRLRSASSLASSSPGSSSSDSITRKRDSAATRSKPPSPSPQASSRRDSGATFKFPDA